MKRILMIATGGTIASKETAEGLAPALSSQELLACVPEVAKACSVQTVQPFNLDSTNICGAHWSRHGTEDLIENWTGVPLSEVKELKYRARPFPGEFQVRTKNGDLNIRSFVNGGGLGQLAKYTPEECRYCLEKAASAADIVVGDTWHHPVLCPTKLDGYTEEDLKRDERIAHARQGMTAVVVRSEAGQRFVDAAIAANAVKLYPETEEGWRAFLCAVHDEGKPKCNGPVIHARLVRKQPVREYF